MDIVTSINEVPIRITEERWLHIAEEHSELAGRYYDILETIHQPQFVYRGKRGEYLSVKRVNNDKFVVAVYREISSKDGFLITAFLTKRRNWLNRLERLWPRSK